MMLQLNEDEFAVVAGGGNRTAWFVTFGLIGATIASGVIGDMFDCKGKPDNSLCIVPRIAKGSSVLLTSALAVASVFNLVYSIRLNENGSNVNYDLPLWR